VRSYRFAETWALPAARSRVHDVLVDLEHYPEWWPQVRGVASLGPDDAWVVCRSVLPYTLDLVLHAVRRDEGLLEVALHGDLEGTASWRLTESATERGPVTRLDFEQRVSVDGWLAAVSTVAAPLLRWNHARMMAGCRRGLETRLR
jgi:hypothetical protein